MSSRAFWTKNQWQGIAAVKPVQRLEIRECYGCGAPTCGFSRRGNPMCPRCNEEIDALDEMAAFEDLRRSRRQALKKLRAGTKDFERQAAQPMTWREWLLLVFVLSGGGYIVTKFALAIGEWLTGVNQ
jgi:hypothetical protein